MNMMLWCFFLKCFPPLNRDVFWIQSKGLWVLAVCIYNFGACPSPMKIGKNDAILTVHFPLKRRQETCQEGPMGLCGNGLINHLLGQFGPPRLQLGRLWHLGRFPEESGFHRLSQPPLLLRALCALSKSSRKFVARSERTFSVGEASEKPKPSNGSDEFLELHKHHHTT